MLNHSEILPGALNPFSRKIQIIVLKCMSFVFFYRLFLFLQIFVPFCLFFLLDIGAGEGHALPAGLSEIL